MVYLEFFGKKYPIAEDENGCYYMVGRLGRKDGYPVIRHGKGRQSRVSRLVLGLEKGDGLFACHHCDNRWCVRKDHLFIGDHASNMQDMADKKRAVGRGNRNVVNWPNRSARRNPDKQRSPSHR